MRTLSDAERKVSLNLVVAPLLFDLPAVASHVALVPEEAALVSLVAPLLVHRARVHVARTRRREDGEAVRAGVDSFARLGLSHHDGSGSKNFIGS